MGINSQPLLAAALLIGLAAVAPAAEPWIIAAPVTVNVPTEVGDVIVVSGGSLTVPASAGPGSGCAGTSGPSAPAEIGQIYEGTSNMQLQTIAKQVLG